MLLHQTEQTMDVLPPTPHILRVNWQSTQAVGPDLVRTVKPASHYQD